MASQLPNWLIEYISSHVRGGNTHFSHLYHKQNFKKVHFFFSSVRSDHFNAKNTWDHENNYKRIFFVLFFSHISHFLNRQKIRNKINFFFLNIFNRFPRRKQWQRPLMKSIHFWHFWQIQKHVKHLLSFIHPVALPINTKILRSIIVLHFLNSFFFSSNYWQQNSSPYARRDLDIGLITGWSISQMRKKKINTQNSPMVESQKTEFNQIWSNLDPYKTESLWSTDADY